MRNYIATSPDPGVRVVHETEEKSQSVLAAKKGSGYMPAVNQALEEMEEDGTTQQIYDKYFSAEETAPSSWDLIKDNAGTMAWATIKMNIPLTILSFSLGLVIALRGRAYEQDIPEAYLGGLNRLYDQWVSSYDDSPVIRVKRCSA